MGQPRILFAMSRAGLFPLDKLFVELTVVNRSHRLPVLGIFSLEMDIVEGLALVKLSGRSVRQPPAVRMIDGPALHRRDPILLAPNVVCPLIVDIVLAPLPFLVGRLHHRMDLLGVPGNDLARLSLQPADVIQAAPDIIADPSLVDPVRLEHIGEILGEAIKLIHGPGHREMAHGPVGAETGIKAHAEREALAPPGSAVAGIEEILDGGRATSGCGLL
jgi:hypothetical protein